MTEDRSRNDDDRVHAESPAEGDPDADPADIRVHSQDPAEGADDDGDPARK
ncbi:MULTISPECIES: hypothetical protein [Micrococcaceae]|jgi:hypothetical protein|uniref:hypothetical protein n=1 Tax=Micrococcaceae TaxID=1268 RepID=UPI000A603957|nr:hypothetical protein [Arthrobacter sp. Soil761]